MVAAKGRRRVSCSSQESAEAQIKAEHTSLDAASLRVVTLGAAEGSGGESESVGDVEHSVRVDSEELADGGVQGDGSVRSSGRGGDDLMGFTGVLDDLHQSLKRARERIVS